VPTFIIHQMGKKPRSEFVEGPVIRIGRDPKCDLVLKNVSVSRRHALVRQDPDKGGWLLEALSTANPVIVHGKPVTQPVPLREGAEIQLGRFFVLFTEQAEAPDDYAARKGFTFCATCEKCGHEQKVGALETDPACGKCGHKPLSTLAGFLGAKAKAKAGGPGVMGSGSQIQEVSTVGLDSRDLMRYHSTMRAASRSVIVRVGGKEERHSLVEEQTCTFGKYGKATLPVEGFVLGTPATVSWERNRYVVRKTGWWPGLFVNGSKVDEAPLRDGDEIRVGKTTFRFVVE